MKPSYAELQNNAQFTRHHSALTRGYFSRKAEPFVREYNGRFGKGYTVEKPYYQSNNYHTIEYYIIAK